jgi:phosphoglycolate phosphatase
MFPAILFDLDGTLIDSEADIAASVNHVRARLGLGEASLEEVRAAIGDGVRALLERMAPGSGGETVAAYVEHQESHCLDRTQLYAGVREGLERLGGKVTMGVVSNKPTALCVQILRGLGVIPHFKVVIGGDTPAGRKPAPGPLLRALESLGSTPWDTLTVGDSPADLEAGRAAGTATAAVTWGYRPAALLASLRPDFTFARFDDLAKAFTRDGAPQNVLEAVGRDALLSLAKGFYARVEGDPRLRPMFPASFHEPAENLGLFLVQFFGGPSDYSQKRGAPRLRIRHANFRIDAAARDAWLENMAGALADSGIGEPSLGILRRYFEHTARFLVNA